MRELIVLLYSCNSGQFLRGGFEPLIGMELPSKSKPKTTKGIL
jgi:hypothetical protein